MKASSGSWQALPPRPSPLVTDLITLTDSTMSVHATIYVWYMIFIDLYNKAARTLLLTHWLKHVEAPLNPIKRQLKFKLSITTFQDRSIKLNFSNLFSRWWHLKIRFRSRVWFLQEYITLQ